LRNCEILHSRGGCSAMGSTYQRAAKNAVHMVVNMLPAQRRNFSHLVHEPQEAR
jgi:hypothetical protein